MGSPAFAVPVLSALLDAGHDVVGVYTRPDKPAGRGKRPTAPPVKQHAADRGLRVFQPASLRSEQVQSELASLSPDVVAVAAYGLFLPDPMLAAPPLGCLNVHPSLLPRYRGASPVASAILSGDSVTGVTVMKINEVMDSGPIIASRETPMGPHENAEELTSRLFRMGALLLVEVLPKWAEGEERARPQDESQATFTRHLSREDGEIDWGRDAERTARQVRAYTPWPGSFTRWEGRLLKIIAASASPPEAGTPSPPGVVVSLPDTGIGVATGDGVLRIERIQLAGKRATSAREFGLGYPGFVGSVVG